MEIYRYTTDAWLLRLFRALIIVVAIVSATLLVALQVTWFPFELLVSFLPQLFIVIMGLVCFVVTLGSRFVIRDGFRITERSIRAQDVALIAASFFLLCAVVVTSFFGSIRPLAAGSGEPTDEVLTIATYNKLLTNKGKQGVVGLIAQRPDIVVLQEISDQESIEYARILGMEHSVSSNCSCSAGDTDIVILSRYPIVSDTTLKLPHAGAVLQVTVDHFVLGEIDIFGVHLVPPLSSYLFEQRNHLLQALQVAVNTSPNPTFVAGDFNTTIYSPAFRDYHASTDQTLKLVLDKNWPQCSRYEGRIPLAALCVRIDHIFVPRDVVYVESGFIGGVEQGFQDMQSDHLPFWTTVKFPQSA